ncbi:hypothetical protein [Actinoplanes awajinensis]|uniref:Uncharacterized protein n=1 Tax=Actinoplanes awajinensis subsp. mycoplanecinus TaxID=135947 RepID=A0A124G8N4_9ACTN|nr:hypothetical protein [Actinoplanes awajinensis]KUL26485.1 hypothetical protein ADL15_37980 [Actinoplanes awajinensis subsp. mycoplanecinus]
MTVTIDEPLLRAVPSGRVSVAALARVEARHFLRSPFLWGGVVLAVGLGVAWSWTSMPQWDGFIENSGMSALVLGAALLIAAHLAAGRDHRAGAGESFRSLPVTAARRGLGLLVTVPIAALTGAIVYALQLLILLPSWPVGRFDPWAVLVVVILPPIGAAVGAVVGRSFPAVAAGPLAVAGIVVALFLSLAISTSSGGYLGQSWPVPGRPWSLGGDRPTEWHLVYLCGILAAVVALISWRARTKSSAVLLTVALLITGVALQRKVAEDDAIYAERERNIYAAEEPQSAVIAALDCRTYADVRYCALPGFGRWTGLWRAAVEPVAALLPAAAARPAVRQLDNSDSGEPMVPGRPEIVTSTSWGRIGPWAANSRTGMARSWASAAVGLAKREDAFMWGSCDAAGQHRTVVGLWLLALTQPDGAARVARGELGLPRVRQGPADLQAVATLLARPSSEVTAYLQAHWAAVLDPAGTALAGLGVTTTPPPIPAAPVTEPESGPPSEDAGVCR